MKTPDRRTILAGALTLVLCARSHPAQALVPIVLPVEDAARFAEMALMLEDVWSLTDRVFDSLAHVRNAAAGLGGGNLVEDILIGHRNLTADLRAIDFSMETVTTQFRQVFPDREAARHVTREDAERLRQGWDHELHQSTFAAARAQTSLSRIEDNSRAAEAILERSKAAVNDDGEGSRLAKLQALVQLLGVINSDLTTLATTIAAAERVSADLAAAEASDENLEAERAERMLRDYDKSERVPDVDRRFLSW